MPARDNTGPEGNGPMTGKGMGNCAGYPEQEYPVYGWRAARWHQFGRGRGFRNRFFAHPYPRRMHTDPTSFGEAQTPTPENEEQILKEQASWLSSQLEHINERIASLSTSRSEQE